MANNPNVIKNLKPFKKGDKRINRKGRPPTPKDLAGLREYIQAFLAEPTTANKTRLDVMLSKMAISKGERKTLLEYGIGKVPDEVKLTGNMNMLIEKKTGIDADRI